MIRLLYDTTIGGVRFGKGSVVDLDSASEDGLIAEGDAARIIYFSSAGLLPKLVAQSYAPITRTAENNANDQLFETLSSVTVPGGTMNLNGELVITQDWKYINSGITKTLAMDWNGSNVSGPTATTTLRANFRIAIKNLNSLASQSIFGSTTFGVSGADISASANTANDVVIDHKCKWSALAQTETIALAGYAIWYYPGTI